MRGVGFECTLRALSTQQLQWVFGVSHRSVLLTHLAISLPVPAAGRPFEDFSFLAPTLIAATSIRWDQQSHSRAAALRPPALNYDECDPIRSSPTIWSRQPNLPKQGPRLTSPRPALLHSVASCKFADPPQVGDTVHAHFFCLLHPMSSVLELPSRGLMAPPSLSHRLSILPGLRPLAPLSLTSTSKHA